ncbi:MAG: IS630 family transposase [Actinobacteria bacterium]|nr:IS630 family transposase [Actinomycetota bacterium]
MRLRPLELRDGDRAVLERRARSKTASQRNVTRARIILMAAQGQPNTAIAQAVGINQWQVGRWRKRYKNKGLDGLKDAPRPGRPLVYGHDDRLKIVKTICDEPPAPASRWTMDAVAKSLADDVGISASQIYRICVSLDLKPWQVRSWMTSHDPDFWEKAADVCGLYLNPPENAIVYSIDEKSGMQAKSRTNPTKPVIPGLPARQEFEYRRHGTAVLYAALEVHEGGVDGWVADSTRSDNFVAFLSDLVHRTPKGSSCTASWTTCRRIRPRRWRSSWMTTRMCSFTTHRRMLAGSTRSSCFCRSSPGACSAAASSTRSMTWPPSSLPSSTTTTGPRSHSAGPTMAVPSR